MFFDCIYEKKKQFTYNPRYWMEITENWGDWTKYVKKIKMSIKNVAKLPLPVINGLKIYKYVFFGNN